MGNHLPRAFLDTPGTPEEWHGYFKGKWRSIRALELDALGGPGRPVIARGASFQMKLEYLGSTVGDRADEMEDMFEQFDAQIKQIGLNLEAKTRLTASDSGTGFKGLLSRTPSARAASCEAAPWRLRTFAARRRLVLMVWVTVRLWCAHKRPTRLRRVDSFSYMIPNFLGADATKFVEEQIRYAEAMREEEQDEEMDQEGEASGGVTGEEEEGNSERWSPDSRRDSPSPDVRPPMSAASSKKHGDGMGGPWRRTSVPGQGLSLAMTLDRQLGTGPGSNTRRRSHSGALSQTSRTTARSGSRGGSGALEPNFFKAFQTYKKVATPNAPAELVPITRQRGSYPGAGPVSAVPPLGFRVPARVPEGKSRQPNTQAGDKPCSEQSARSCRTPNAAVPTTPQIAFLSESLRLPSIAMLGRTTVSRPLRHKSSLVQHWVTSQGTIQRTTNNLDPSLRVSTSGALSKQLPLTGAGLGPPGVLAPQPSQTAPPARVAVNGGRPQLLQRPGSPGSHTALSISASLPSLTLGGYEPCSSSNSSLPRGGHATATTAQLRASDGGGRQPTGTSFGTGVAAGHPSLAISMDSPGSSEHSPSDVLRTSRPRLGLTGGAVGFQSRAASRRLLADGERPRVKWDAESPAAHASHDGSHGHFRGNRAVGEEGTEGQHRNEALLLASSNSEPALLASASVPADVWCQNRGDGPCMSGPESLQSSTPRPNPEPGPGSSPWGLPAQGRVSSFGQASPASSLGEHLVRQQQLNLRTLVKQESMASKVYFHSSSVAADGERSAPGAAVGLDSGLSHGTDTEDDACSTVSGRSAATSVFSMYNSEYNYGDSEYEEERDAGLEDEELLDPKFWRQQSEEQSSQPESPQGSGRGGPTPQEPSSPTTAAALPKLRVQSSMRRRNGSGRALIKRSQSRIHWEDSGEDQDVDIPQKQSQEPDQQQRQQQQQPMLLTPVSAMAILQPGLSRQPGRRPTGQTLKAQPSIRQQAHSLARSMSRRHRFGSAAAEDDREESELDKLGTLGRSKMMMRMYVNRCNAAWAEQQAWSMPNIHSLAACKEWEATAQSCSELDQAQRAVRAGKVAFWFLAGEDHLPAAKADAVNGYTLHDVWTADPYALIRACRPGLLHGQESRKGHSYQSRALGQLSLAVTAAGGKRALASTCIILHVNDEQQELVTRELWDYKFYGFARENVIIVMQPKRPGYRYDSTSRHFIGATGAATHPETTGTGLAAMQLNWCPDSFVLNTEGVLDGLHGTPLEVLSDKGVDHLLCYRARDLAVLTRDQVLNLKFLALARSLHHTQGTNIATQVLVSDSTQVARSLNSVVLTLEANTANAEMRMGEMSSHHLSKVIAAAKAEQGGKVTIGLQRYLFHLPNLKEMLSSNEHFRPRLRLHDELLFVSFDLANVTSLPGASLAALQVREHPDLLLSRKELSHLLDLVRQQDQDDVLMNLLDSLQPLRLTAQAGHAGLTVQAGLSASDTLRMQQQQPADPSGSNTVVFVDGKLGNLAAVRMAAALARPGRRDTVNLVHFVADSTGVPRGRSMLLRLRERLGCCGSAVLRIEVLVRGASSLLGAMQGYVSALGADLVVVPSDTLGRSNAHNILGSVSLAILKAMTVPVLLVTPRCSRNAELMLDKKRVRMLLMVEGWSLPLLEFASERLLVAKRGDKLLLGQAFSTRTSTRQQMDHRRWHMADFRNYLVKGRHLTSIDELQLDGEYNDVVQQAIVQSKVNLLGVHLPPNMNSLPKSMTALLCSSQAGVLVMKKQLPAGLAE